MNRLHTGLSCAAAFALAGAGAFPAAAQQNDDSATVSIMQACRQIDDLAARTACYDNTIDNQAGSRSGTTGSNGSTAPAVPGSPPGNIPSGFGAESVPQRSQPASASRADEETELRVDAVSQRQPGIYRLTLEDGGEWQFVDNVPRSYTPPRKGVSVTLIRAAMGSFLMRYRGQASVRIRRLR